MTIWEFLRKQLKGSNEQVFDGTVTWANSEAVNSIKTVDIALPDTLQKDGLYEIIVTNPSTETTLTVSVKNKETFSVEKYPELKSISVPADSIDGKANIVQGWLLGEAGRLTLSNDTAVGAAGTFVAEVRVRKI